MEDNLQTIIVVIISIFILFIFPIYMAYEKKDDISYALAMRYTQDLVDEVRNKGYITKYIYDDYRAKLKLTGNSYDIQLQHGYKRYDPITKYYNFSEQDKKFKLVKTTTREEKETLYNDIVNQGINNLKLTEDSPKEEVEKYIADYLKTEYDINKVEDTYEVSTQVYTENHILNVLNSEKKLKLNTDEAVISCNDSNDLCQYAYTMNVGDTFNVIIKNTNITLATVIYNMVTANVMEEDTRIYVNYGGTILSNKWYGNIDYAKLEPTVNLGNLTAHSVLSSELTFDEEFRPVQRINDSYNGEYRLEFDVKPGAVTELKEKGEFDYIDYSNFNFALGNSVENNENAMMSVAVGYNGILLTNNSYNLRVKTAKVNLPTYTVTIQEPVTITNQTTGKKETKYEQRQEERQRKITEYKKVKIERESENTIKVTLTRKSGGNDIVKITVSDSDNLLVGLNTTINNPVSDIREITLNSGATCTITFTDTAISIKAKKPMLKERIILSYPVDIKEYTHIGLEVKEKEIKDNEEKKYTVSLFINGEKKDESVELDQIPEVDFIGSTYIGTLQKYYIGSIKNITLYK